MKNYYNVYIDKFINDLIAEKDEIVEDITTIATSFEYQGEIPKFLDLKSKEVEMINSQRNNIGAIYQLINDLEKLRK